MKQNFLFKIHNCGSDGQIEMKMMTVNNDNDDHLLALGPCIPGPIPAGIMTPVPPPLVTSPPMLGPVYCPGASVRKLLKNSISKKCSNIFQKTKYFSIFISILEVEIDCRRYLGTRPLCPLSSAM